jgi:sterol desaturase/sphingolipid hydroxylase (fatty acid hydroxylase superfamily)
VSSTLPVLGAFLGAAALEVTRPWRPAPAFAAARWLGNLALLVVTIGLNLLLAPVIAIVAFAGLHRGMPLGVQLVVGVAALDALSYALHRLFHASPILWRLHALHHSDPELDVSTTVRHHPGEALLMGFAVGVFATAVGLSPFVIGVYASLNLAVQFFAHANFGLPPHLGNALGWLVVTPVLHRVHHSRHPADVAANYGLVFSVWDRLLGTYRSEPEYGEDAIEFGVDRLREPYFQRLDRMLWMPFLVRENI